MLEIDLPCAQQFVINQQMLLSEESSQSILEVIKRIHNVQIDTISVVARSHDLILYNRCNNYQTKEVWEYLKKGKLFEYWSHAACLLPIEEYPFYVWKMNYRKNNLRPRWKKWVIENQSIIDRIYNHVENNGATCSADFKNESSKAGVWWSWKEEKTALEYLFNIGKLAIAYRENFQKYYDLTERVIPSNIDTKPMNEEELPYYLVKTIFTALGIGNYKDFRTYVGSGVTSYLWNNRKKAIENFFDKCINEDLLVEIKIKGTPGRHFALAENQEKILQDLKPNTKKSMKFLSPFDNLIRERNYPKRLWNFDYKLEAYVPKNERIYGYYVLPILDKHEFIGRTNIKTHRKEHHLEIKGLFFEEKIDIDDERITRLTIAIKDFARFHHCESISINKIKPQKLNQKIESQINI
ncbi:MAG: hypothetical protein GF308_06585 [Candidatus Heimdallarchaeota archaeon]|nr:hypothetical protein [Candidatus Heimdallarchaeota archaeon]